MTRILVFDSGVGGLSILSEISRVLPEASFVYVADTAFFPYGTKPEAVLIERVPSVLTEAIREFRPDIGVVACNSASTVALEAIRARVDIPIVGTVPAVKPAASLSRSKVIGLLATPGTIERDYTDDLIKEFALGCRVIRHGSSELVALAENKIIEGAVSHADLHAATQDMFLQDPNEEIDVVVLACTHFPLIAKELSETWPDRKVTWIDSGEAIARRVVSVLAEMGSKPQDVDRRSVAVSTDAATDVDRLARAFAAFGLQDVLIRPL